jgi:glycosyltransferase involved in cell wall biosynthesis
MTRVAIVHERFTDLAGSERVVEQLAQIWPDADVFAPVVDRHAVPDGIRPSTVHDTWLRRLYRGGTGYAHLLPLLPLSIATLDLSGYDLVLTSHHAFANRVRPDPHTPVISYTHTPARWIWEPSMRAGESGGRVGGIALAGFAASQRRADRAAARRLRAVVANSSAVAGRVRRWWGRDAHVVHPPVDVGFFTPDPRVARENFFLFAGRLVPYKAPAVAAAAARLAGVRLVVAGDGRARRAVEAAGGPAVEVLGRVTDAELRELFRRCRALVVPGVEDFGIVTVEAQACGAPVIAAGAGGSIDTVLPGRTGVLHPPAPAAQAVPILAGELARFDADRFAPDAITAHAAQFSQARFRTHFRALIDEFLAL